VKRPGKERQCFFLLIMPDHEESGLAIKREHQFVEFAWIFDREDGQVVLMKSKS